MIRRRSDRAPRAHTSLVSWAALATSVVALVVAASGLAGASPAPRHAQRGQRSQASKVVHLTARGKLPVSVLPTIPVRLLPRVTRKALDAAQLAGKPATDYTPSCPRNTTDIGTWCLMTQPYQVPTAQVGDNDYQFATQACEKLGGYLPTAGQLIGAAPLVSLESVITDTPATSTIQTDPTVGEQDQREMSATLVTVAAGSDAAGSEGVSVGATGNPNLGQPTPVPQPANPWPETLQYVTVYDNHNSGGFAGSEPVSAAEHFRCAFDKIAGGDLKTIQ